jgi:hypothetical protein
MFFDAGNKHLLPPFFYAGIDLEYKLSCIRSGEFSPEEISKSKKPNDYTFRALFLEKQ